MSEVFDVFNLIADISVIVAFALASVFLVLYSFLFNWRKTSAGRAIWLLFLAWVSVSLISFLAIWVSPDYWLRPFWRMAGWLLVVAALVNLVRILIRNFFRGAKPLDLEFRHPTGENPIVPGE